MASYKDLAAPRQITHKKNALHRATPHTTSINTLQELIVSIHSVEKTPRNCTVSGRCMARLREKPLLKKRGKPSISRAFPRVSADRFTRESVSSFIELCVAIGICVRVRLYHRLQFLHKIDSSEHTNIRVTKHSSVHTMCTCT